MWKFLLIVLLPAFAFAQSPIVPATKWALDELTLTNGSKFQGMILEDSPAGVRFMTIRHVPGRPTITLTSYFPRADVGSVKRIADKERALLKERLAELDPSGNGERKRMEALQFEQVEWLGTPKAAKRYEGEHFVLVSSAPDEVTRRATVRLEQIYAAFIQLLPPRHEMGKPTTILLTGDLEQYKKLLAVNNTALLNAAVFDPSANRIICGTDLRRLGDELQRTRIHHVQQLTAADGTEQELRAMYKNNKSDLERYLTLVKKERARISAAERDNDRTFDVATRRVFAMLYHEAFHSYAMNYVFPVRTPADIKANKGTGELPRWLNEGMAQLFENPLIEAGELRVDNPDAQRLKNVKDWLAAKKRGKKSDIGLIPLRDLLKSGKETFLAAHASQQEVSDRSYLSSWALAYYLTFERRVFGTKALDRYIVELNLGTEPVLAFSELIGKDWDQFEQNWHDYFERLNADGTVRPMK